MELLIVVFLLAYSEKDENFRERLKGVLDFYRKNRELLLALTATKPDTGDKKEENTEKPSPREEGESLRVLDEFLKKI